MADGRVHGEADAWKAANEGGPRVEGGQGRGAYGASRGSGELYCLDVLLIESVWALGADNLYTFTT